MLKRLIILVILGILGIGINGCRSLGFGEAYWTYHKGTVSEHISHPTVIPIYVDGQFDAGEKLAIEKAAKDWDMVFNGQVKIIIDKSEEWAFSGLEGAVRVLKDKVAVTGQGWVILRVNHDHEIVEDMDSVLAFVRGPGGHSMVVIGDVIGSRDLKTIVMHEMGHLLGAEHVNMSSLMIPYYSNSQYECIDKVTVMQVARFMKLDFDSLNYCITPRFE